MSRIINEVGTVVREVHPGGHTIWVKRAPERWSVVWSTLPADLGVEAFRLNLESELVSLVHYIEGTPAHEEAGRVTREHYEREGKLRGLR